MEEDGDAANAFKAVFEGEANAQLTKEKLLSILASPIAFDEA